MPAQTSDRLSEHFRLSEFASSAGDPVPHVAVPAVAFLVCQVLEPLRAEFGPVTITSGYRTPRINGLVGGARESRHLYDRFPATPAVDFRCARGTSVDWFHWLDARVVGGVGYYRDHVHVDLRARKTRW